MFVHHAQAGVNTIWDTVPKRRSTKQANALRPLIREAMRERGIASIDGKEGLAKRSEVSRNTIYAWEGGAYPSVAELQKVASALGRPAWELLRAWQQKPTEPPAAPEWARRLTNEVLEAIDRRGGSLIADVVRQIEVALEPLLSPTDEAPREEDGEPQDDEEVPQPRPQ